MSRRQVFVACVLLLAACGKQPAPRVAPVGAEAALDAMDQRAAVPLLPMMANHQKQNMRDHLLAVQEIIAALGSDDFAAIERAVKRIGFSEQMGQMCTHMGRGAPGFAEQALDFHHAADRIADAARQRDRARVLVELGATLQTCTSCHAKWKQRVVDDATWQQLTAATDSPAHGAVH